MNDDARSAPLLETLLGTVLTRLPLRVLNLAIDQLPDGVYRVALEAHDGLVRICDAALTHSEKFATRAESAVNRHPQDAARMRRQRWRTITLAALVLLGCLGSVWVLARAVAEGDLRAMKP